MWTPKGYGDNQGWYKPSAAAAVFSLTNTDSGSDTSNSTTVNYGTKNFGAADPNRIIVVAIGARFVAGNSITSVTIGGVAATLVSGTTSASGTILGGTAIYQAAVPTGTSGAISATFSSAAVRSAISVYRLITNTPTAADGNNAATTSTAALSASVNVPSGGGGLAAVFYQTGTVTFTWTNAVEDVDFATAVGTSSFTSAKLSGTGAVTATSTASVGGQQQTYSVAAWGP